VVGRDPHETAARVWGDSAEAWARAGEKPDSGASAAAAQWMLEAAQLQPGERVLEVACGAGRVGLEAATIVGEEGAVVCSDFAEPMVEAVRARANQLALANVEARVLDATDLALPDDERFDAVLCRFGYMLMSDPAAAVRESVEALRPAGRLSLAVWGLGEENPWIMVIFDAVMAHLNAPPPEPGAPGPFALGDPEYLYETLAAAGLDDIFVDRVEAEQAYGSAEEWWAEIRAVSGPLAAVLDALPDPDQQAIRDKALEKAQGYASGGEALTFPAVVVGGTGVRSR
jgi:SAM-dependent methyltransferase